MISFNQVAVFFGGFELFSDVSFLVSSRERVGLVGKNGAGKTTILYKLKKNRAVDTVPTIGFNTER